MTETRVITERERGGETKGERRGEEGVKRSIHKHYIILHSISVTRGCGLHTQCTYICMYVCMYTTGVCT